jgi:uncharacterized membrane protein
MNLDFMLQVVHEGSTGVVHSVVLQFLRWAHFFFGIAWIGHLYFFNFVQVHFEKALNGDQKKIVVPNLRGRALWWFRWGAMITFLTGVLYLLYQEFVATQRGFSGWLTPSNSWILFGGILGTVMWFNVWFVIWPAQKKLITWTKTGQSPPEMADLTRRAFLASRLNTYLSVPLLFCMGAASHFPSFNTATVAVMALISVVFVWHLVNKVAPKVGANF